ncbi:hypothetical protein [Actinoplanes philippinensis]|uniref:hypothetical protein n=1 Tax=Actinoplanes philippinensis TaxID=35752 RepID=UPI0033FF9599
MPDASRPPETPSRPVTGVGMLLLRPDGTGPWTTCLRPLFPATAVLLAMWLRNPPPPGWTTHHFAS